MMRWLFRPWLFLALSAAVVAGALALSWAWGVFDVRTGPLPVAQGDREIVWLYPASSTVEWERFVVALRRTARAPGLRAHDERSMTFPRNTTDVPEAALSLPGQGGRLVFRWYKLTSEWTAERWITALLQRHPPPLAIIGGDYSDTARDLANQLGKWTGSIPEDQRPLLLLTTATADDVHLPEAGPIRFPEPQPADPKPLLDLYAGRTFRFCFSNPQMAAAVLQFIWTQDDLRPDRLPAYRVKWEDDDYSRDLIDRFDATVLAVGAMSACRQWGWITGAVAGLGPVGTGGGPFPWDRVGEDACRFRLDDFASQSRILSSVGPFDIPNTHESEMARYLVDDLRSRPPSGDLPPKRPLLVLTGQEAPCRRFLHALMRSSPDDARRCVVATGDALGFNTIYRDRQEAWHIQDLPYPLVFFSHHNPIDRDAGFKPDDEGDAGAATGTEDVLLYQDVLESLAWAAAATDVAGVRERLGNVCLGPDGHVSRDGTGVPLFNKRGGRRHGTGEHIVCLRPHVAPGKPAKATIEVWSLRRPSSSGDRRIGPDWHRVPAWYRISDRSLAALKAAGVPQAVLAKLHDDLALAPSLKDKAFATRDSFLEALVERLGPAELGQWQDLLLDQAGEPLDVHYEDEVILGRPLHGN
jgi:hypothetical protein